MGIARMLNERGDGPPVYTYEPVPGAPPVSVLSFHGRELPRAVRQRGAPTPTTSSCSPTSSGAAARCGWITGSGRWRTATRTDRPRRGGWGWSRYERFPEAEGWTVPFRPRLSVPSTGRLSLLALPPALFPFVGGTAGGAQRLKVPPREQPSWSERFSALDLELRQRRDGYQEAVLSHLTLLLVELSRLAADVVGDLRLKEEPLLAEVFGFIEEHYSERISLKEVARRWACRRGTSPRSSGARRGGRLWNGSLSAAWHKRANCSLRPTWRWRRSAGE